MTDDTQQQPADAQQLPEDLSVSPALGADPLASLEDLLNKAKAKRTSNTGGAFAAEETPNVPSGPSEEELKAQQLAEQQAQLAEQEAAGEILRQQQLEEQRQKMANELQNTPEYQARQEQNQEVAAQAEETKAAQQGHVIHQVSDAKI